MASSAPRNARKRPQDVTGRKAEELAAARAEELAEKAKHIAMVTAQTAAEKDRTVDLTGDRPVEVETEDDEPRDAAADVQGVQAASQVVAKPVAVSEAYRVIRTNCDLEQVTIGHGTSWNFEQGVRYKVPKHVADHLEEKGLVWH